MFPTTIWTTIDRAGADDPVALEEVGRRYREPVLRFIRGRGFGADDAEDVCQDVFVRVLRGGVLGKADPGRGRFRSLILAVTMNVIRDRLRRRREFPVEDLEPPHVEAEFDRAWAWHLTERALQTLREQGSPYYDVLRDHVAGRPQDRNRLWIARKKLSALVRQEVATTCATREDLDHEMAYLARFLRPGEIAENQ